MPVIHSGPPRGRGRRSRVRVVAALAVACGAVAATAAPADAAQTFGADLSQAAGTGCAGPCTVHTRVRSDGVMASGSPVSGVLTKVRIKYSGDGGSGRFAVLRPTSASPGNFSFVHVGPDMPFTVPLTSADQELAFDVRRPIAAGDRIALIAETLTGLAPGGGARHQYFAFGAPRRAFYIPKAHGDGATEIYQELTDIELLVNATVEPDADADGFGDETQDACAGTAGPQGGCQPPPANDPQPTPPAPPAPLPPDVSPPTLTALTATRTVFAVARARTPVAAVRRGTTFRYSTTEGGAASFAIHRALPGRRSGRRCVRPTRRLRRVRRCTRYVAAGTLGRAAVPGANALAFSGRIGARALRPGRYRLTVTVTDAAGNRSRGLRLAFRVVPG